MSAAYRGIDRWSQADWETTRRRAIRYLSCLVRENGDDVDAAGLLAEWRAATWETVNG